MIKRTLVRMTIWNSTVVFCLLIMLGGGALYGLARYRIYSDIDRQLVFNIDNMYQTFLNNGEKVGKNKTSWDPSRYAWVRKPIDS
jgi:two-component system, OmpR family, sensor histidine kinase CiaH